MRLPMKGGCHAGGGDVLWDYCILAQRKGQQAPSPPPHLHARCGDGRVAVDFDGEVLAGSFPAKKLALLRAWIVLHREELEADWLLASSGQAVFRIEPLR